MDSTSPPSVCVEDVGLNGDKSDSTVDSTSFTCTIGGTALQLVEAPWFPSFMFHVRSHRLAGLSCVGAFLFLLGILFGGVPHVVPQNKKAVALGIPNCNQTMYVFRFNTLNFIFINILFVKTLSSYL